MQLLICVAAATSQQRGREHSARDRQRADARVRQGGNTQEDILEGAQPSQRGADQAAGRLPAEADGGTRHHLRAQRLEPGRDQPGQGQGDAAVRDHPARQARTLSVSDPRQGKVRLDLMF